MKLSALELTSNEYKSTLPYRINIRDLVAGGIKLDQKKENFLRPRPAEDPEIYKDRLKRFTYTNLIGAAIAQQATKFRSGTVQSEGEEWLTDVRTELKEKDLLGNIFSLGWEQGCVYLLVPMNPGISGSLLEQNKQKVSVLIYSPLEVVIDAMAQDEPFVKIRQYKQLFHPEHGEYTQVEWIIINPISINVYRVNASIKDGKIAYIYDENFKELPVDEETEIDPAPPILHGLGRIPIQKIDFKSNWFCNEVYYLALECLNLQNSVYDTCLSAGYIQRTVKVQPDDDLDNSFIGGYPEVKSGSEYIIHGDFAFNEAAGTSINSVQAIADNRAKQIQLSAGLPIIGSMNKGAIQQSGLSKILDFAIQESVLSANGSIIIEGYREVLEMIAIFLGHDPSAIAISGLDSFEVDALAEKIEVAQAIQDFANKLPPTAQRLFYEALANLLNRNMSLSDRLKIKQEIEKMSFIPTAAANSADPIDPNRSTIRE